MIITLFQIIDNCKRKDMNYEKNIDETNNDFIYNNIFFWL